VFCFLIALIAVFILIEVLSSLSRESDDDEHSELIEIEGYPDYPQCLEKIDLQNVILEEELCRLKFGYKKMSD